MLESIISSLDLSAEEIKTYLLLLEIGPTTVGNLAGKIGKPRPTLYGFLQRLQEKGLVAQSLQSGVKTFAAQAPAKISQIFQEKIENLEHQQKLYKAILPAIEKNLPLQFLSPKFQLYEGKEGLKYVLKDMLLYSDIETQAFWPIKAMLEALSPDFFRYLNKERIRNDIYTRAIWPKSQSVDIKNHPYLGVGQKFLREIRIAPDSIDFVMGYWIYKNKAAFISSRQESFGFIIESRELVEMLLTQFEVIWKLSQPIKPEPKYMDGFLETV